MRACGASPPRKSSSTATARNGDDTALGREGHRAALPGLTWMLSPLLRGPEHSELIRNTDEAGGGVLLFGTRFCPKAVQHPNGHLLARPTRGCYRYSADEWIRSLTPDPVILPLCMRSK